MVKMCGARPVAMETSADNNYIVDSTTLRETLKSHPKTKAIILCNPSNPTGILSLASCYTPYFLAYIHSSLRCTFKGGVASRSQLEAIANVLIDFPEVIIISDEIYEQLTYDTEHVSFASLPDMFDRTVTINGFSKSHSMTGYVTFLSCTHDMDFVVCDDCVLKIIIFCTFICLSLQLSCWILSVSYRHSEGLFQTTVPNDFLCIIYRYMLVSTIHVCINTYMVFFAYPFCRSALGQHSADTSPISVDGGKKEGITREKRLSI